MNNEPVAWMNEYEQICHATDKRLEEITNDIGSPRNYFKYNIPLYTHPVKELTDEEMLESAEGAGCVFDYSYKGEVTFISKNALKRFVLSILRKASEK